MCEKCDVLQTSPDITGSFERSFLECLRPFNHSGPHLVRRSQQLDGEYVLWETLLCRGDDYFNCPGCQSDDPEDHCVEYRFISSLEARRYLLNMNIDWNELEIGE
jgi:hypothetical protein